MWWLTLRLQRAELILLVAMAVLIIASLLATRNDVVQENSQYTIADCPGTVVNFGPEPRCVTYPSRLYNYVTAILPATVTLPLIIAVLVALPTVLELASRTYRLAWTQSRTRATWSISRVMSMTVIAVVVMTMLGLLLFWWTEPRDTYWSSWGYNSYDLRGVIPVGNVVFALGLVLAVGALIKQPLITLALSTVLYFVVRVPFGEILRPRLLPPDVTTGTASTFYSDPSLWVLSSYLVDANGSRVSYQQIRPLCPEPGPPMSAAEAQAQNEAFTSCFNANGITNRIEYHPESHLWPLQFIEAGIFLALGAALIGFAVWYWLRRLE